MRKVSRKLWIAMVVLVLLVTGSLLVFQIFFLEDFYIESKISKVTNTLFDELKGEEITSSSDLFENLDSIAYSEDINIEIVDAKRNTIYISGETRNEGNRFGPGAGIIQNGSLKDELIDKGLAGQKSVTTTMHPRYGFEVQVLSVPFMDKEETAFVALATFPLASIGDMIGLMSRFLVFVTIILVLLTVFLSYFIARNLSASVKELTAATEALTNGDYSARAKIRGKDEISTLAETFNKMASRLQKTEKFRKEIIENVSHELRTPLAIIRGYAETIKDVTGEDKKKREDQLEIIVQESERLGVLVDDMLDYSQMQSGLMELKRTEFDVVDLIKSVISKYNMILEESNVKINFKDDRKIYVLADPVRIEQVLQNLIKNGINYSPDGKDMEILIEENHDRVRVKIKDQGIGIPKEEMEFIWDRYYRTKGIRKRRIFGSGLGLSIVRSILIAHGADFSAESEEGKGTMIWFELKKY